VLTIYSYIYIYNCVQQC